MWLTAGACAFMYHQRGFKWIADKTPVSNSGQSGAGAGIEEEKLRRALHNLTMSLLLPVLEYPGSWQDASEQV